MILLSKSKDLLFCIDIIFRCKELFVYVHVSGGYLYVYVYIYFKNKKNVYIYIWYTKWSLESRKRIVAQFSEKISSNRSISKTQFFVMLIYSCASYRRSILVGGFNPMEKLLVKMGIFPK